MEFVDFGLRHCEVDMFEDMRGIAMNVITY